MPEKLISLLSIDVIFVVNFECHNCRQQEKFSCWSVSAFFFANIVASVVDCLNVN